MASDPSIPRRSHWRQHGLAALAAAVTIVSGIWQFVPEPSGPAYGPWALLLASLVLFLWWAGLRKHSVQIRFRVLKACMRMKECAGETIDIAAGDCSWLTREHDLLIKLADRGIEIRLLCRPSTNSELTSQLAKLSCVNGIQVRTYPSEFREYLRCIIVDRDRPQAQRMLLLDKHASESDIFGLIPLPGGLRTDHEAILIEPTSRTYSLIAMVFDQAFEQGPPLNANPN